MGKTVLSLPAFPRMASDSVDDFGIFLRVLRGVSHDYSLLARLCAYRAMLLS